MLEYEVRATTQQILVASKAARGDATRNLRPSSQRGPSNREQGDQRPQIPLTPFTIAYEKLLPLISELLGFRWLEPIKSDPVGRDHNKKCAYHKDHGHTTERCKSLHYLVKKLLKAGQAVCPHRRQEWGILPRTGSQSPISSCQSHNQLHTWRTPRRRIQLQKKKTKTAMSHYRLGVYQFHPAWFSQWKRSPNRWSHCFPSNRSHASVATSSRCSHPDIRN